jgi:hypothetical protein
MQDQHALTEWEKQIRGSERIGRKAVMLKELKMLFSFVIYSVSSQFHQQINSSRHMDLQQITDSLL